MRVTHRTFEKRIVDRSKYQLYCKFFAVKRKHFLQVKKLRLGWKFLKKWKTPTTLKGCYYYTFIYSEKWIRSGGQRHL